MDGSGHPNFESIDEYATQLMIGVSQSIAQLAGQDDQQN
jgi:hypothetical protein